MHSKYYRKLPRNATLGTSSWSRKAVLFIEPAYFSPRREIIFLGERLLVSAGGGLLLADYPRLLT